MTALKSEYAGCIALICKMENDEATFAAFRKVMRARGEPFAQWLSANGVPEDIAKEIAKAEGDELYKLAGEAVCKHFW